MIKIKTKINNVQKVLVKIRNVNFIKTKTNNIHKFNTTLLGATIIYMLQIFNKSKFNCMGKISLTSKVIINDVTTLNGNVSANVCSNAKIKEVHDFNGFVNLNLEYTTPLTWNNLITKYSTWEDVLKNFNTWDDVKTYR